MYVMYYIFENVVYWYRGAILNIILIMEHIANVWWHETDNFITAERAHTIRAELYSERGGLHSDKG